MVVVVVVVVVVVEVDKSETTVLLPLLFFLRFGPFRDAFIVYCFFYNRTVDNTLNIH